MCTEILCWVLVLKQKLTFEKGYKTNGTKEFFVVTECVPRDPAVCWIKDLLDEPIQGTFYSQELHKGQLKKKYATEKYSDKRTHKRRVEYKGYPSKFDQCILSSDFFCYIKHSFKNVKVYLETCRSGSHYPRIVLPNISTRIKFLILLRHYPCLLKSYESGKQV